MSGGKPEETEDSSTVFHQQLQSEYNALLKRFAEAENTIDQLRTGARIRLYTDPQDAKPANCGDFQNVRHSQRINLSSSQAVVSSVTAKDDNTVTSMKPAGRRDRKNASSEFEKVQWSPPLVPNTKQDESLPMRIQSLKENVDSLENHLSESDITSTVLNEVSGICKQLDEEHKELCRELKTYKQLRFTSSSAQSEPFCFTSKKDLEKELYRIGLRLREIQQKVSRRHKAGKTSSHLRPNQQAKEPISGRINISPSSQTGASALDPDLTNLLAKLKDLQDASARDNREILSSCRADRSNDSSSEGLLTNEPRRGRCSSSSPSESHDRVDARYLAASPVQLDYEPNEDVGNEGEPDAIDYHHTAENEEPDEQVQDTVDATFASDLEDCDWPSQHKKPSSSGANRHRAASPSDKPLRPTNRNHEESYSSEDRESGDHSRPPSPLSDPGNETIHEISVSRESPSHKHNDSNRNKAEKNATPLIKDQCRKSNSLSSLVDSSRMSTPLFHPRGATRVSSPQNHRGAKYKRCNPADGFDSGFVGSEESRSSRMTTSPDIMGKLNLSNPWDSSLHLDLVSEMDENDSATSHEQLSTTYELATESARRSRSPMVVDRTPRDTGESTLVNSSPSPPSSPDRTRRKPARYFGYSTSRNAKRQPSSEFSSPVPRVRLSDPSLSRISEKTSSERSSRVERTSGASRNAEGRTGEHRSPGFRESTRNVTEDRSGLNPRKYQESLSEGRADGEKDDRDSLIALRHDITRLRNQIKSLLDEPRVTLDIYDDHRRQDEQFRETLERKNEQKLDELRESVDRLAKDFRSRATSDERPRPRATRDRSSHDDLRSQVKHLSEKFDELSELRRSTRRHVSESPPASDEDDIQERVHCLSHKLDGLRLRVESDGKQGSRRPNRYFCRLCDEGYHGYNSVPTARKPQTSTPLLSGIYETSRRQPTTELGNRPIFRNLSSTYPGVQTRSPVVHHIHTYHRTPSMNEKYETGSSSEEEVLPKRSRHRKRPPRRLQSRRLLDGDHEQNVSLAEASRAAQDVQRLSKNILNAISLDLASLRS